MQAHSRSEKEPSAHITDATEMPISSVIPAWNVIWLQSKLQNTCEYTKLKVDVTLIFHQETKISQEKKPETLSDQLFFVYFHAFTFQLATPPAPISKVLSVAALVTQSFNI